MRGRRTEDSWARVKVEAREKGEEEGGQEGKDCLVAADADRVVQQGRPIGKKGGEG